MISLKAATEQLLDRRALSAPETEELFTQIFDGGIGPAALAGFLVAMRANGETAGEIAGAARAMRAAALVPPGDFSGAVDTCGTGGDGRHGFNLSTAAALVACAAGAKIAKHGNRSVSSKSGSADILEALGMAINLSPDAAGELYSRTGFTFLFAPNFHPAMKHAAPVRKALGLRTIFNLLGPLTNPARVKRQLIGVYDPALLSLYREAARRAGLTRAIVVHGGGYDEIIAHGTTLAAELCNGHTTEYEITPEVAQVPRIRESAMTGGDATENGARLIEIFAGGDDPIVPALLMNAGYALVLAGVADGACTGAALAAETIRCGAAKTKLAQIIQISKSLESSSS